MKQIRTIICLVGILALLCTSGRAQIVGPNGGTVASGGTINPGVLTAPAGSAGTIAQYSVNGEQNPASPTYVANPRTSVVAATTGVTNGTTAVTLGAADGFVNGEGIAIYGAGPNCNINSTDCGSITVTTPTVTQTGYTGAASGTTITYQYQVSACDAAYGCTAASTANVAVNGPAVLSHPNTANGTGAQGTGGNYNVLSGYGVTGAAHYLIWRNTNGAGFVLWAATDLTTFNDWSNHATMGTGGPYGNTPLVAARADVLATTIAAGGGTTAITLGAAATQTGTFTAWPDATAAFAAAASALTTGGTVRIPVGYYKLRSLTPPNYVVYRGASTATGATKGVVLQGTPGYDFFSWTGSQAASDNGYYDFVISSGRSAFGDSSTVAFAHQYIQNVTTTNMDYAGIYCFKCPMEEVYGWNTFWSGGWYGFDFDGDGTGTNYVNKVHFDNTQYSGQAVNGIRLYNSGSTCGGMTWTRTIVTQAKQDAVYVDVPLAGGGFDIDGYTDEGTGSDLSKHESTATCTNASNTVTATSFTGLKIGANYTVLGCGLAGDAYEGTICACAASAGACTSGTLTIDDPTCATPVNAQTTQSTPQFSTDAIFDNFYGAQTSGAFQQMFIANANLTNTGGSGNAQNRFQIFAKSGVTLNNTTGNLMEDPNGASLVFGVNGTIGLSRPSPAGIFFTPGQFETSTSFRPGAPTTITSADGSDMNFGLVDSVGGGSGTYGNFTFYNNKNTGRQKLFRIEGQSAHLISQGDRPTVVLNGCGTIAAGSVTSGTDVLGSETAGTTTTSCVIHFADTWATAPKCWCEDITVPANVASGACTANTTDLTIPMTSNTGNVVQWLCMSN